jgi:epoxide hydrolase-like predicted phosphatase
MSQPAPTFDAVIFDLGGVIFDSPLELITEFERRNGLPEHLVARLVGGYGGEDGVWHRLERGEVLLEPFCELFDGDVRKAGHAFQTAQLMREMAERAAVRPAMLTAIKTLREHGLKVAALTNNWVTDADYDARLQPLRQEFDVFVESCKVGMRKPDPRIYRLACERLGVPPERSVFLDDIGGNLKAAKALGMATIKVAAPEAALSELGRVVGFSVT